MRLLFSQQFCSVVPYQAGGALVAGRKLRGCLVQVTDEELTIVQGPSTWIDRAAVTEVEVDTPKLTRALGSGTFVRMNGNRWAIDFGQVPTIERLRSGGVLTRLAFLFGFGAIQGMRRARDLNTRFRTILLETGAIDRRGDGVTPNASG